MNNIIKLGFFWAFVCFYCNLHAQLQNPTNENYKETHLFEYGAPLTSSEINFKNLFLDKASFECKINVSTEEENQHWRTPQIRVQPIYKSAKILHQLPLLSQEVVESSS